AAPDTPSLPSFPTRRSSDLQTSVCRSLGDPGADESLLTALRGTSKVDRETLEFPVAIAHRIASARLGLVRFGDDRLRRRDRFVRSEEHTSELQSRENLVCRL